MKNMLKRSLKNILTLGAFSFYFFIVPTLVHAQSININLGNSPASITSKMVQMIAFITVISIAPSILVMVTSFTRIVIVFGLLRTALGVQQSPPNSVLISLALFLTFFIMQPTLQQAYQDGISPLMNQKITEEQAWTKTVTPFRTFMLKYTNKSDLNLLMKIANIETKTQADVPLRVIIPAFMMGEIKRGFEIGFLLFIPFLIIDMVIASVLMSLGMMMLPPASVSLPFKLIFFVLVNGWQLVVGSLVKSFM